MPALNIKTFQYPKFKHFRNFFGVTGSSELGIRLGFEFEIRDLIAGVPVGQMYPRIEEAGLVRIFSFAPGRVFQDGHLVDRFLVGPICLVHEFSKLLSLQLLQDPFLFGQG